MSASPEEIERRRNAGLCPLCGLCRRGRVLACEPCIYEIASRLLAERDRPTSSPADAPAPAGRPGG